MKTCDICLKEFEDNLIVECGHAIYEVCNECCSNDCCDKCDIIVILREQLSEAYAKISEMKCCGNCAHYVPLIGQDQCDTGTYRHEWMPMTGSNKCDKWEIRRW